MPFCSNTASSLLCQVKSLLLCHVKKDEVAVLLERDSNLVND